MNEEVNLWDEIIDDELHKQIYNVGFQKGKLEQKKEELEFLKEWYGICCYKSSFKDDMIEERIKQLQKEIGGMK